MTEAVFKYQKPNAEKMLSFGFESADGCYVYHTDLADGQMKLAVTVHADGRVFTEVTDEVGERYILHLVPEASGTFVGRVKDEYEAILDSISASCFDTEVFTFGQTKAVIGYVKEKYGDKLEFLWQRSPDNAVVRRKDNKKWYAAILTVSRRKLGFDCDERVEIIDLRVRPEEMEKTLDNTGYFPGYHMNKKHWITICLDGTVDTEEICDRIDESYLLARG